MDVNVVLFNTHTTYDSEICEYPHINIISPHHWNPTKSCFPIYFQMLETELGGVIYIIDMVKYYPIEEVNDEYCAFDMNNMNRKIASNKATKEGQVFVINEETDIATSDVPNIKTFQSL